MSSTSNNIRIDESADGGIVVTALQVVEPGISGGRSGGGAGFLIIIAHSASLCETENAAEPPNPAALFWALRRFFRRLFRFAPIVRQTVDAENPGRLGLPGWGENLFRRLLSSNLMCVSADFERYEI